MSDHQSYFNSLSQGHIRHDVVTKTEVSVPEDHLEIVAEEAIEEKHGYLSHMLTNTSTKGLLPDYPSWALTCLGTYSSYSPATGWTSQAFFLLATSCCRGGGYQGNSEGTGLAHVGEPTSYKQRKKWHPGNGASVNLAYSDWFMHSSVI
ncbi:hypothetical protein EB796_015186 [Bugula neritina]|uniref:Uncharacterized protein n=1 Tax=Bugula neritina TaxID=10212 RepID=A0A7J7JKA9_BUGNE|nr:hypothetical protein EB796_015186 [Bugula neritina]